MNKKLGENKDLKLELKSDLKFFDTINSKIDPMANTELNFNDRVEEENNLKYKNEASPFARIYQTEILINQENKSFKPKTDNDGGLLLNGTKYSKSLRMQKEELFLKSLK